MPVPDLKGLNFEYVPDSLVPWAAKGPGWSNRGVILTVRILNNSEPPREEKVTLYDHELLMAGNVLGAAIELTRHLEERALNVLRGS